MQNIDKFRTFFDSHAKGERKVFFVRTRRSNPLPDTSGSPMERMTKDDEMRIWDQLIERLRSLGVKKAFISGRNYRWHSVKHDMYAVPDDLRKYVELGFPVARSDDCLYLPGGCVGQALVQLRIRGIDCYLTNVTSPITKKELKKRKLK